MFLLAVVIQHWLYKNILEYCAKFKKYIGLKKCFSGRYGASPEPVVHSIFFYLFLLAINVNDRLNNKIPEDPFQVLYTSSVINAQMCLQHRVISKHTWKATKSSFKSIKLLSWDQCNLLIGTKGHFYRLIVR